MDIQVGKQKGIQLRNLIKSIFDNGWIELLVRWFLGVIFVYASHYKILAPADFAKIVYGYDLFPGELINLIAIIVPFIELIVGLALIAGYYPQSAALIVTGMLVAFIVVLSINLIRGHEFNCGCFSLESGDTTATTGTVLMRDFILLAMGLYVWLFRDRRKLCLNAT